MSEFFRDQLTLTVTHDTTWRVELSVHGLAVMDDGREFVLTFVRTHFGPVEGRDPVTTSVTRCHSGRLREGEGLNLFESLLDEHLPRLSESTIDSLVTHVTLQFDQKGITL